MSKSRITAALLLVSILPLSAQSLGHRITATQVIVDRASHWNVWDFPPGTVDVSASGEVASARLVSNVNAALDIVDFLRLHPPGDIRKEPEEITILDAVRAGSNVDGVVNVLDGDPTTYWQPDEASEDRPVSDQWWFTIDLGRYVIADRIVLTFAEDADPLLLFDVLISDGFKPFGVDEIQFTPILQLFTPNKTQREFVIELKGQDEAPGRGLRYLQLIATGSDGPRGSVIDEEEYRRRLEEEPATVGIVDYYRRQADGRQIRVDPLVYEQLSDSQRGDVVHYRREIPRLAEVEVWSLGGEILKGVAARGGTVTESDGNILTGVLADGEVLNLASITVGAPVPPFPPEGSVSFDLGAFFWIDREWILFPWARSGGKFGEYRIEYSDGSLAADGTIRWTAAVTRQGNRDFATGHEYNEFEPVKARYYRLIFPRMSNYGLVVIGEMGLHGVGYLPEVTLESDLIRLGSSRNLLSIEWDAVTPPGTQVLLQTRTGNELEIVRHFYKQVNPALPRVEVTETEYNALRNSWKAGIEEEELLGSDWSDWSEPYALAAGSPITSPSPRRYAKMRATLLSDRPEQQPTLRSARLNFIRPVAQQLVGEIARVDIDPLGVPVVLSLYVRPVFQGGDPGFDQLLLTGPADMKFDFVGLYAGAAADFETEVPDLASLQVDDTAVLSTSADSLQVSFGRLTSASGVEVVRLDFHTTLFSSGALLTASLQNAALGGGWQRVDVGDALSSVASNSTTLVGREASRRLFADVTVPTPVATPNGDGVNDTAVLAFAVLLVADATPVEVEIRDLAGRLVRRITEQRARGAGRYEVAWDGLNDNGDLVAPGLYLARVRLDADLGGADLTDTEIVRTLAVAY
jgi:hypothetical protein